MIAMCFLRRDNKAVWNSVRITQIVFFLIGAMRALSIEYARDFCAYFSAVRILNACALLYVQLLRFRRLTSVHAASLSRAINIYYRLLWLVADAG